MLWSKPDRRIGSGLLDHIDWVPLRRVNLGRRWLRLYTVVMIRWAMLSQLRNDYSLCPWLKVWPLWAASISSKPSRCQILSARMRQIVLAPTTSGSTIFVCATITILWETRCELMRWTSFCNIHTSRNILTIHGDGFRDVSDLDQNGKRKRDDDAEDDGTARTRKRGRIPTVVLFEWNETMHVALAPRGADHPAHLSRSLCILHAGGPSNVLWWVALYLRTLTG